MMEEIQIIINKLIQTKERSRRLSEDRQLSRPFRDKQKEIVSYLVDMLPDLAEVFDMKICAHCDSADLRREFTDGVCNRCNNNIQDLRQTASDGFD